MEAVRNSLCCKNGKEQVWRAFRAESAKCVAMRWSTTPTRALTVRWIKLSAPSHQDREPNLAPT